MKKIGPLESWGCRQVSHKARCSLAKLTLVLLNPDVSSLENSVDPDQLASGEASWSGSTLFSKQSQIYSINWNGAAELAGK